MKSQTYRFAGSLGEELFGRIDLPEQTPLGFAIFAHCFTCSHNLKAVSHISAALTGAGYGVLRFDFTGLGESAGDFADTNFSSNVKDINLAAEFLASEREAPKLLIGHSLGGAAVLRAAGAIPGLAGVATIGAPYDPAHVTHLFDSARVAIESEGEARVTLGGRPFRIQKQFLEDLRAQNPGEFLPELRLPVMILHSPLDKTVGIDNAAQIFHHCKHPKSFVSLDTADHLLTDSADSRYAGEIIAAWVKRYL